ncbi:MAG: hypothetical protein AAF670_07345 [Planctomycetota bacterium]
MRKLPLLGWYLLASFASLWVTSGCRPVPGTVELEPGKSETFDLVEPTARRFDWPVSRSGFAIRRPPIYASLVGLHQEPLDELDLESPNDPEPLEDEAWFRYLRSLGTNPLTPFQMKPIHLQIAELSVTEDPISFIFSADGEALYICDGATIDAYRIADDWKQDVPFAGTPTGQAQEKLWSLNLPDGRRGDRVYLAVTACGGSVDNEFDLGLDAEDDGDSTQRDATSEIPISQLVVVAAKSTRRIDPASGEIVSRFKNPPQTLDYLTAAMDAGHILATTDEGSVYFNGEGQTSWTAVGAEVQPADSIESRQSIALNSSGTAFIGLVEGKPATTWIRDGRKTVTSIAPEPLDGDAVTIVWPDNGRYWCDDERVYSDQPNVDEGAVASVYQINKIIWRPVAMWPQRSGAFSPKTGMTVLGLRRLRDGTAMWSLWDQNSRQGGNSVATELFDDRVLARSKLFTRRRPTVAVSTDASRVAYLDPASPEPTVRVIYRNPWERIDSDQVRDWYRVRVLGSDQDRSEIDRAGQRLRELPMGLHWGRVPEELYMKYVETPLVDMISTWQRDYDINQRQRRLCEQIWNAEGQADPELVKQLKEDNRDILTWDDDRFQERMDQYAEWDSQFEDAFAKIKRWQETGSVTAAAVQAHCAIKAAWRARGGGYASQVTEEGWETFQVECEKAEAICLDLLERPRPPMVVFSSLLQSARGTSRTKQSVEPYVRRCHRLYPNCPSILHNLGFWLLPRWGGQTGDSASYIETAVSNCDPEIREKVFAISHIRLAESFSGNVNYFAAMGADETRVWKGALKLLDEEAMANPHWLGPLLWVSSYANHQVAQDAACRYQRENFAYAYGSVYNDFPSLYQPCFRDRPEPR